MTKFSKYKKHYNSDWEKEAEFKAWLNKSPERLLMEGSGEAFCKWCQKPLRAQKADLRKHALSAIHQNKAKTYNSRLVQKISSLADFSQQNSKKDRDIRIAMQIACHSTLNSIDHLSDLLKILGKGSILENIQLHRTKCTKLIQNVIAPAFLYELIQDIGASPFSVILDESTSLSSMKYMAYCVRYFSESQGEIVVDFLGFTEVTEATADKLTDDFLNYLKEIGLNVNNLIGIGTDGAANMCGCQHSFYTNLKKVVPHLMLIKCLCHSIDKSASYANEELPSHLEYMLRETRSWFNFSPKRQLQYQEIYKTINNGRTPTSLGKWCDTRWLSWAMPVRATVEQWLELKSNFETAANADKKDKCYAARFLAQMYSDKYNLLYFLFLNEILPDLNKLNMAFQQTDADITMLYTDLKIFLLSLVRRFIKPCYLKYETNSEGISDGMLHQRDIEVVKKALQKANNETIMNCSLLPLDCVDFGQMFQNYVEKENLPKEKVFPVKERCVLYLNRLSKEIIERIPLNLDVVTNLRYLTPNKILGNSSACNNFNYLPWDLAEKDIDKATIQSQWRRLCTLRLQDVSPDMYIENSKSAQNKGIDSVKFWSAVRKLTDAKGDFCYKELADFALRAYSLPVSNAVVERVFSVMGIVKNKLRNRMSFLSLVSILRIRIHLKVIKKCCKNYSPNKKMLVIY